MKILHLISGGDTGGAKTHVLTLLKQLNRQNITAKLVCIMEGEFTKEARALGIEVTVFEQARRTDMKAVAQIQSYILEEKFDVLHCHGARANFIALFLRRKIKIPMVTTIHSDYLLDFKDSLYKRILFTALNRYALKKFSYYIAVTDAFKTMLIQRGFPPGKIFVVYNGVDVDAARQTRPPAEFLQDYNISYQPDKVYIGIAARLSYVKGVEVFTKAAVEICKKTADTVFLIAGAGEERHKCQQLIQSAGLEERIHMLGYVKDIYSFYQVLDINALTSFSESFPYSLLEGGLYKKATICSAVGGVIEMIEDGETGLLFEAGNVAQLVQKMLVLVQDKEKRIVLGEAFHEKVKHTFSAQNMAALHQDAYKRIMEEY